LPDKLDLSWRGNLVNQHTTSGFFGSHVRIKMNFRRSFQKDIQFVRLYFSIA
ncbi:hypothetical protein BgiMline_028861, partial [Biomphalaria glabrata]